MTDLQARFVDVGQEAMPENLQWPALVIPKADIDREIERLADLDRPAHGRRMSRIVHPMAGPTGGLAPGIDVTLSVLKPGEETAPIRSNASSVAMCIQGAGSTSIGVREICFERFDVWTTPGMMVHTTRNDGPELQVRLVYSNAPLLRRLEVLYVEEDPPVYALPAAPASPVERRPRAKDFADNFEIGADGARLMGYEHIIDPDFVPNLPLHFPWSVVASHLDRVSNLGPHYTGRRLYLLYNPATERRNGTTHNFFASIAKYPAGTVDQPHRHSSAAINYYFSGNGRSVVSGKTLIWQEGDLMLSAPGWSVHNHAARDLGFHALTIQDHPLHIAMDSLIWQETLKSPVVSLGTDLGPQTNRAEIAVPK